MSSIKLPCFCSSNSLPTLYVSVLCPYAGAGSYVWVFYHIIVSIRFAASIIAAS